MALGRLLMQCRNNKGPRHEFWGTPIPIYKTLQSTPLTFVNWERLERYDLNQTSSEDRIPS